MLALASVVALFTALSVWLALFITRRLRIPLVVTVPIAWTAVEWLRTYFPIGFPWNLLGTTQYQNLALIQFAEITGTYGISALIMFFNAAIFTVLFRRGSRRLQIVSLSALTAAMIAAVVFGNWRIARLAKVQPAGKFRVAMVQGNIGQSIKWDPNALAPTLKIYLDQSRQAAAENVDLIAWPEAAMPFLVQPDDRYPAAAAEDAQYRQQLVDGIKSIGVPVLIGAPALVIEGDRVTGFSNRAYLISSQGNVVAWYDKIQLVPFGEYVPFRAVLGIFVEKIVHGMGDMIAGKQQTVFDVKQAKLAVLICYESIFPSLSRTAVRDGADVLVNITNDAWYGTSSAPYQLLAMAAMRSVETKAPMIRVANTGISAIIQPTGKITAATPLFKRGTEIEDVAWHPVTTVYVVIGDLFAEICFALAVIAFVLAWRWPCKLKPLEARVEEILSRNGKRAAIN
jgi:apolipoprotein N-acyltransferase